MVQGHNYYVIYLPDLLQEMNLMAEDCKQMITDIHISEISSRSCKEWKWLGPHLICNNSDIVVNDIDSKAIEEKEKRLKFLQKWVDQEGSGATYYKLIDALLKIPNKKDAEFVCRLVKQNPVKSSSEDVDSSNGLDLPDTGIY